MYRHCYAFSICQLPRCNSFTHQVIYLSWRRHHTSELWTLVHSFTIVYNLLQTVFPLLTTNNHHLPHHTFNPFFSKTGEIDNLTVPLGQSILVVFCACSMLLLTSVVAPCQHQWHQPSEVISFSYWSIKPWFHT